MHTPPPSPSSPLPHHVIPKPRQGSGPGGPPRPRSGIRPREGPLILRHSKGRAGVWPTPCQSVTPAPTPPQPPTPAPSSPSPSRNPSQGGAAHPEAPSKGRAGVWPTPCQSVAPAPTPPQPPHPRPVPSPMPRAGIRPQGGGPLTLSTVEGSSEGAAHHRHSVTSALPHPHPPSPLVIPRPRRGMLGLAHTRLSLHPLRHSLRHSRPLTPSFLRRGRNPSPEEGTGHYWRPTPSPSRLGEGWGEG